ncbi:hypothetical protein SZN_26366 [Streptomyces zinciresistens K42]|uniref:Uncharacterized protein n=1 Tax=Streptomyces zinciresistens K42 TaxID=700597 RepID=G2GID3_9ACTN|nr:hypothetical protein [Streptomyces zinciresistens]EGX56726.1 hypothetical protein SZN_26366 [Streptomyces zinciresistens K42]
MGQRYYADPQRIEALTRQLEEIGTLATTITEEFLDDIGPTITWPGTEGDFAKKAKPQEQQERQTTKETMMSVRDAIVGITDATVNQVRMMKETRDRNVEGVDRVNKRLETNGLNGDGPGGHGRR